MAKFLNYDLDENKIKYDKITLDEIIAQDEEYSVRLVSSSTSNLMQKIENFKKLIKNTKLHIVATDITLDKDYIDDESELKKLKAMALKCYKDGIACNLILNDGSGNYKDFVIAKKKVDEFLDRLHSLKISENGKERGLTVAERFFVVYNYVANRVYNENENFMNNDMRNWMGVLSSDHVICSGFASLLKFLCDREFTKDELICFTQSLNVYQKEGHEKLGGHANNIVYIKDPYYQINNFTYNDACWDCKKDSESEPTFNFLLLNPDDIFDYKFHGEDSEYDFASAIFYDESKNIHKEEPSEYLVYISSNVENAEKLICEVLGGKTSSQIKEEYDMDSKIEQDSKRNELEQQKKKQEYLLQYKKMLKDNGLEMAENLSVPMLYLKSTLQQHPEITEFEDYFNKIDIDNLDPEMIKRYYDFVESHKELFDDLRKKAEGIKFKIFDTLENMVVDNTTRKNYKNINPYEINRKRLTKLIEENSASLKERYQKFNKPLALPEKLLRNGLTAVALMQGLTVQSDIDKFVEEKTKQREDFRKEKLGMQESETDYDEEEIEA